MMEHHKISREKLTDMYEYAKYVLEKAEDFQLYDGQELVEEFYSIELDNYGQVDPFSVTEVAYDFLKWLDKSRKYKQDF